jgi:hypothetical protein
MPISRTWYDTLVDDDGSGTTGSVWDKADVDSLLDAIDAIEGINTLAEYQTGKQSTTLASGDNNNVTLNAGTRIWRLTGNADGTSAITGITGGADGRVLTIFNIGGFNITIKNVDASSTAANRIGCPGLSNFTLNQIDAVDLWYDSTTGLWRVKAY